MQSQFSPELGAYFVPWANPSETTDWPKEMISPFLNTPHPMAQKAARALMCWLQESKSGQALSALCQQPDGGKMFGVLLVQRRDDRGAVQYGYLQAFSGMLAGQWCLARFVPPLFDVAQRAAWLPAGERVVGHYHRAVQHRQTSTLRKTLLAQLETERQVQECHLRAARQQQKCRKQRRDQMRMLGLSEPEQQGLVRQSQADKRKHQALKKTARAAVELRQRRLRHYDDVTEALKKAHRGLSLQLQRRVFSDYPVVNFANQSVDWLKLYPQALPPGGAGDCAGAKLLFWAQSWGLKPLAMAEFWWGHPPKKALRRHQHFYPACRSKCGPLLPAMLRGTEQALTETLGQTAFGLDWPKILHQDQDLWVVHKPAGMLSVPGNEVIDSVQSRLQQRFTHYPELKLVHRLDMSTSGLLLVAKHLSAHKLLQQQFAERRVTKRYQAVLSEPLPLKFGDHGEIELPLRVDLADRPRQMVCFEHGKAAHTRWRLISEDRTRIEFQPVSGRTHQLRVHAAHPKGLNTPLLGDELYGVEGDRLHLHAASIRFRHPSEDRVCEFELPAPF